MRWQVMRLGDRVSWNGTVAWEQVASDDGRVWFVSLHRGKRPFADKLPPELLDGSRWICVEQTRFTLRRGADDPPDEWCLLSCWDRADRANPLTPPVISCWP